MKSVLAGACAALLAVALAFIAGLIAIRVDSPLDVISGLFGLAFAVALLRIALEIIWRKPRSPPGR